VESSAGEVAVAVGEAMGQARTLATAAAANAGVRLGRLLSVEIKPIPAPGPTGTTFLIGADLAGGRVLRTSGRAVEVTSTYEVFL
jgi:uncharacterized protein YggE